IGGERWQAAVVAECPAELDRYVFTLGEAALFQAAAERFEPVHGILRRARAHKPDHRQRRLLRPRRERPRRRASDKRDELPPPHGAYPKAKDHGTKYSRCWSGSVARIAISARSCPVTRSTRCSRAPVGCRAAQQRD